VGELTNSRASETDGGFIRTTTDQAAQATRLSLCLIGVGQVLIDESPSPPLTIRNPQSAIRNSPVSVYRNGIPTIAQGVLLGTVGGSLSDAADRNFGPWLLIVGSEGLASDTSTGMESPLRNK
jgi:hypothetical protein